MQVSGRNAGEVTGNAGEVTGNAGEVTGNAGEVTGNAGKARNPHRCRDPRMPGLQAEWLVRDHAAGPARTRRSPHCDRRQHRRTRLSQVVPCGGDRQILLRRGMKL